MYLEVDIKLKLVKLSFTISDKLLKPMNGSLNNKRDFQIIPGIDFEQLVQTLIDEIKAGTMDCLSE